MVSVVEKRETYSPNICCDLTNNLGQGISCSISDSLARCYKYEAPLSAPVQTLSHIKLLDKQDKHYSYLDLIKTPELRKRTLLTGIMW